MLALLLNARGWTCVAMLGMIASGIINGILATKLASVTMDIDIARGHVEAFEMVLDRSINDDITQQEAAKYISEYYPDGKRMPADSPLSLIIESARRIALKNL